jgi:hypothetical protein
MTEANGSTKDGLVSPGEISADPELQSRHGDPRFAATVAHAQEILQSKASSSMQKNK